MSVSGVSWCAEAAANFSATLAHRLAARPAPELAAPQCVPVELEARVPCTFVARDERPARLRVVHGAARWLEGAPADAARRAAIEVAAEALQLLNAGLPRPEKAAVARVRVALSPGQPPRVAALDVAARGPALEGGDVARALTLLLDEDLDEAHAAVLHGADAAALRAALAAAVEFASHGSGSPLDRDGRLELRQERAVLAAGDAAWRLPRGDEAAEAEVAALLRRLADTPAGGERVAAALRARATRSREWAAEAAEGEGEGDGDEYWGYANQFLLLANARELRDFERAAAALLDAAVRAGPPPQFAGGEGDAFCARSGMRLGISSANASDNWTSAKLRGGVVLNLCLDLAHDDGALELAAQQQDAPQLPPSPPPPQPPLAACVSLLPGRAGCVVLESSDRLSGAPQETRGEFSGGALAALAEWGAPADPLRMLKAALFFAGVFPLPAAAYRADADGGAARLAADLQRFTRGRGGLSVRLSNRGPSRSGFASSSAVASNLLAALFAAGGRARAVEDRVLLAGLAVLFENQLGLKSGRQDADGLLPGGLKQLYYPSGAGFLAPRVSLFEAALGDKLAALLPARLLLVDTGVQRATHLDLRRGLNLRHFALLSRAPRRFPPLLESLAVHDEIVAALARCDWAALGAAFRRYMRCRERIDPGATSSLWDEANGGARVLLALFDRLEAAGLSHGGMLCGAMGGGVAMIVLTDRACADRAAVDAALRELREDFALRGDASARPFARLRSLRYVVNTTGVQVWREKIA
jgi:hypothetical protein